MMVEEI